MVASLETSVVDLIGVDQADRWTKLQALDSPALGTFRFEVRPLSILV